MSDEIKQVLGFDAAQALAALNQLDAALKRLHASLDGNTKALNAFNTQGAQAPARLNAMASAANAAATAYNNLSRAQGAAAKTPTPAAPAPAAPAAPAGGGNLPPGATNLTVSPSMIGRILTTQAVIKGLRLTERAFIDATKRAAEFEVKVAQIATIAGNEFGGLDDISRQVRQLAETFGTDLAKTAEGVYETISNQVGNATDAFQVNTAAMKLAVGTGSQAADTMNLISGAMNSFGMDASRAEEIAAKFFQTIDLGRIKANELANTYGRVAPVAAQLGITFDEVNAALSVITIQGTKTNEAMTQLRGIMNALQKPSVAMKDALAQLGFSESRAAIETMGLGRLLVELKRTTDGSATAMAKLFPRIRGLTGAIVLARKDGEAFEGTLAKIATTGQELLNQKFDLVMSTNAKQVEVELNKLKIAMTDDLGSALLEATNNALKFVGGADAIIATVRTAGPVIVALVGAVGVYAAKAAFATIKTDLFTKSVSAVPGQAGRMRVSIDAIVSVLGLLTAAYSAGQFIGEKYFQSQVEGWDRVRDAAQGRINEVREQHKLEQGLVEQLNRARTQEYLSSFQEVNKAHLASVTKFRNAELGALDAAKEAFKGVGDAQRASITGLESMAQSAGAQIKSLGSQINQASREAARLSSLASQARSAALSAASDAQGTAQRIGEVSLRRDLRGKSPEEQADELLRRARQFQEAGQFDQAAKLADQAASVAQSLEQQQRADDVLLQILNQKLAQEQKLVAQKELQARLAEESAQSAERHVENLQAQLQTQQDNSARIAEQIQLEKEKLAVIKQQQKAYLDNRKLLDDQNNLLSKTQREELGTARNNALSALQGQGVDVSALREQEAALAQREADLAASKATLQRELQKADKISKVTGIEITGDVSLQQAVQAANERGDALIKERQQIELNTEFLNGYLALFGRAIGDTKANDQSRSDLLEDGAFFSNEARANAAAATTSMDAFRDKLEDASGQGRISTATFAALKSELKDVKTAVDDLPSTDQRRLGLDIDVEELDAALQTLQNIQKTRDTLTQQKINFAEGSQELLDIHEAFRDVAPNAEMKVLTENLRQAGLSLDKLPDNFNNSTEPAKAILEALEKATERSGESEGHYKTSKTSSDSIKQNITDTVAPAEAMAQKVLNGKDNAALLKGEIVAATDVSGGIPGAMAQATGFSAQIKGNMEAALAAARQMAGVEGGSADLTPFEQDMLRREQGFAKFGGFFSHGGTARGTDTQAAMLSKGESVINARSTQAFFSQLQAINAGQQPVYHDRGSEGTTIGDINVTVQGGETGRDTARTIAHSLRRELRRGTSRL